MKFKNIMLERIKISFLSLTRGITNLIKPEKLLSKKTLILTMLVIIAGYGLWKSADTFSLERPNITITRPETGQKNIGENLFVEGKVFPKNSAVYVNGEKVALNGDGSFTAIILIPMGESVIKVEAHKFGKKATVLQPVVREPTEEELAQEREEEEKKKHSAVDKAAQIETLVNDLYAAKNAKDEGKRLIRIFNNRIEQESGFSKVVGEVLNMGDEEVTWVMITATFLDESDSVVDTKYGFATNFGEVLKPKERVDFITQTTRKQFDHYKLDVSWEKAGEEEEEVAGEATESADNATSSAETDADTEEEEK